MIPGVGRPGGGGGFHRGRAAVEHEGELAVARGIVQQQPVGEEFLEEVLASAGGVEQLRGIEPEGEGHGAGEPQHGAVGHVDVIVHAVEGHGPGADATGHAQRAVDQRAVIGADGIQRAQAPGLIQHPVRNGSRTNRRLVVRDGDGGAGRRADRVGGVGGKSGDDRLGAFDEEVVDDGDVDQDAGRRGWDDHRRADGSVIHAAAGGAADGEVDGERGRSRTRAGDGELSVVRRLPGIGVAGRDGHRGQRRGSTGANPGPPGAPVV